MDGAVRFRTKKQSPTDSYDAFISYSQTTDAVLAAAVQEGLQRLARPWHKSRALEVFRDEVLSNSPNLGSDLHTALSNSRFLVVLASPGAAASPWVRDEIQFFLAKEPDPTDRPQRDRVLLVVTDGEIKWAGDGRFTSTSTAVPDSLQGVFEAVPKYTDLRLFRGHTDLTLDHPEFKRAVADIAAPIHGKKEGQLVLDKDAQQFRVAKTLRWAAVTGLAVLTVAALIASVIAVAKGREAVTQKNEAQAQTVLANAAKKDALDKAAESRSRELAATALALKQDDPAVAALLAVESLYPTEVQKARMSPAATNAVGVTARALLSPVFVRSGGLVDSTRQEIVGTVGNHVATIGPDGVADCWPTFHDGVGDPVPITWWDRATGTKLAEPPADAVLPKFVNVEWGVVRLDDPTTATPVVGSSRGCLPVEGGDSSNVTGSTLGMPAVYDEPSNRLFAFDQQTGGFVAIDVSTGSVTARVDPPSGDPPSWRDVVVVDGAPGNRLVMLSTWDNKTYVTGLATGGGAGPIDAEAGQLAAYGNRVFWGSQIGDFDLANGANVSTSQLPGMFGTVNDAQFSPDGRFLAVSDGCDCRIGVWDVSLAQPAVVADVSSTVVSAIRWSGDELGLTSARGVEFYDFADPPILRSRNAIVSGDGSTAVTLDRDRRLLDVHDANRLSGEPLRTIPMPNDAYQPVLSYDGRLIVFLGAPTTVVDVDTGQAVFTTDRANAVEFDPTGNFMAIEYSDTDAQGIHLGNGLEVVDARSWSVVANASIAADAWGWKWISDHELVTTSATNGMGHLATVADGEITFADKPLDDSAPPSWSSPDGSLFVTADSTGRLQIRPGRAARASEVTPYTTLDAAKSAVTNVAFSPDGHRMVTSAQGAITMWDVTDPRAPQRVEELDSLPLVVSATGGGPAYRSEASFLANGKALTISVDGSVLELPDFDPARICAEVTTVDVARAEAIIGSTSACTRIAALQP